MTRKDKLKTGGKKKERKGKGGGEEREAAIILCCILWVFPKIRGRQAVWTCGVKFINQLMRKNKNAF